MSTYGFLALSVNKDKLYWKLIKSLYSHYTPDQIRSHNFHVIGQGYSEEDQDFLRAEAPDINFIFTDRIEGSISKIRRELMNQFDILSMYDYLILIDDDFNFGQYALEQYDHHILELDNHPEVGLVSCHRRMKTELRVQTSSIEIPYPQDLSVISMRTGLIVRRGAITPDEMFNDNILYHEEFYLALRVYLKGYEVGKAWVDVYHQSRQGGLGNSLQKKYHIFTSNEACSAKKVAIEQGYFEVADGEIYYGAQNVGHMSQLAHDTHNKNKEELGL